MWFVCLSLVLLMSLLCDSSERDKRIIYGGHVGGKDPGNYYSVIRYYAWISNGHECDINVGLTSHWEIPVPTFLKLHCTPDPWHLSCGGAIITGVVVATACHCIASFDAPRGSYSQRQARVYNHWERFSTIFIGSRTDTHAYHYGTRSKGFLAHRKCALLHVANYESWLIHDYGWIYLEKSLIFSPDAWVNPSSHSGLLLGYAPSYTDEELAKMFNRVLSKQLVCLFVGYGRYEFIPGTQNETNENSLRMKYGFNVMMDYKSCRDNTNIYIPPGERPVFKYQDDASWSCSQRFGLRSPNSPLTTALFGHGDSGGPVTCNNIFFGVVSQGKTSFNRNRLIATLMMTNCNAFAVWQNAINYRQSFLNVIKGLQALPDVFPTFRPVVPDRRFFEYQQNVKIPPTTSRTSSSSSLLYFPFFTTLSCITEFV